MNDKKFFKLTPFKKQVLQSFPFIDADFDALTNYELLCKVVEYLNITVENVNLLNDDFQTLYNYVHDYFNNLDVQEEINNKLDDMAESGELEEIISLYLNTAGIIVYNTVNDMKNSDTLVSGSVVKTLGYYSINDGGGALYKVTDTETEDFQEELSNNLYGTLIINNIINARQFGVKTLTEDGNFDNTSLFNKMMTYGKTVIIPTGSYNCTYIQLNGIVYGNNSTINVSLPQGSSLCQIKSNSTINDLTINCTNGDRNWNRIDLTNQYNIKINNCNIIGFRHDSLTPNAWGLYLDHTKNVNIYNCKFDNNTQSDIAIVDGCENINIESCIKYDDYFRINLEPNSTGYTKNITIKNCTIDSLTVQGNIDNLWQNQNLTLLNNDITSLKLESAIVRLINNKITTLVTPTGPQSNKILENTNSIGLEKNLVSDMLFNSIQAGTEEDTTNYWIVGYTTLNNSIGKFDDSKKGKILRLNTGLASGTVRVVHDFNVTAGEQYCIRALMNTIYPAGSGRSGRGLIIGYYDNTDTRIGDNIKPMFDRSDVEHATAQAETVWDEKALFITIPNNCVKLKISICNFDGNAGVYGTQWKYLKVNKVNLVDRYVLDEEIKSIAGKLPPSANIPAIGTNNANLKGDVIYLTNDTNYLGYCTASGQPATWSTIDFT